VETSRLFARTNAAIDPAWAEQLAGPLAKRSYSEPRWERGQGAAVADEKVTLFGVPIVAKRRIQLSRVDPALARELFIRHALVEEDWDTSRLDKRLFRFLRANRELRRELGEVEERTRRRDILAGDEAVVAFYASRVPADVSDTRAFERWWRGEHRTRPELFTMAAGDLVAGDAGTAPDDGFPDRWRQGDQTLSLAYRFEPGADDDGVSVIVPLVLLPRLAAAGFDWQVPGLRDELITAMLRTLPKVLRRQVVPAAEWAAKIAAELPGGPESGAEREPFTVVVGHVIRKLTFTPVDPADFELERVPPHLRMTFRAVDERGRVLGTSKDLAELQSRLAGQTREAVAKAVGGSAGGHEARGGGPDGASASRAPTASEARAAGFAERSGVAVWDWDEIPAHLDTRQAGNVIRAYPALVDEGATVALRLVATAEERDRASRRGIRRLLVNATPSPVAYVQEHLSNEEKLQLAASAYAGTRALLDDCLAACVDAELRARHPDGLLRTRAEFDAVRDAIAAGIMDRMFETVSLVARILKVAREADRAISGASSIQLMAALGDARTQLQGLVPAGFVSTTGLERLRHMPRYLEAITIRIRKLVENPGRDRQAMNQLEPTITAFEAAGGRIPIDPEAPAHLVRVRWMLEELRVGLFAQELRTAETVSPQRIAKALAG
jgi:ATP-dependent helicase HrpA